MNILIVENSISLANSICYVLLSLGIKGFPCVNRKDALGILNENPDILIGIIDIDNKPVEGLQLIEEIKKKKKEFKTIAHTSRNIGQLSDKIIKLGVIGYISKPLNEKLLYSNLDNIFSKLDNIENEKREYIRISPDPENPIILQFRTSNNNKLYSGKVINLSIAGIAFEVLNPLKNTHFEEGITLRNLNFYLDFKQITGSAKILLIRGKLIVIKFTKLTMENRTRIAKYVFQRISS